MNNLLLILVSVLLISIFIIIIKLFNNDSKDNFIIENQIGFKNEFTENFKQNYNNIYKTPKKNYLDIKIPYDSNYQNKTVYRLWCYSDINMLYKKCGGRVGEKFPLEHTMENLPGWKQVILGNKEKDEFMYKYFGKGHIITRAYYMINPKFQVARSDLLRYLILYVHGGLYLDFKTCITNNLPDISMNKDLVVRTWPNQTHLFTRGEIINWFAYGKRGSPIIKDIINQIVYNILHFKERLYLKNVTNIYISQPKRIILATTGPIAVSIAILRSKHRDKVEYDNNKYSMIRYNCNKNKTIDQNHYSKITEELVI